MDAGSSYAAWRRAFFGMVSVDETTRRARRCEVRVKVRVKVTATVTATVIRAGGRMGSL